MFKKDEYIVCLNTPRKDSSFPTDYIFKQREDCEYLCVYLDAIGLTGNGWGQIRFDGTNQFSKWRNATIREIEEYEKRGIPYNVTTLEPFILPEVWSLKITNENRDIINNWRKNIIKYSSDNCNYTYIFQDGSGGHHGFGFSKNPNHKEITFSQFKEYVLAEKPNEDEDLSYLINLFIIKGIK